MPANCLSEKVHSGDTRPLIYVVDDDPNLAEITQIILQDAGFAVRSFTDPAEALNSLLCDEVTPDLLLTDFDMGAMTGLQLVECSRRKIPALKAAVLSGTVESSAIFNQPIKINRFLRKPYQPGALVDLVNSLLAQP